MANTETISNKLDACINAHDGPAASRGEAFNYSNHRRLRDVGKHPFDSDQIDENKRRKRIKILRHKYSRGTSYDRSKLRLSNRHGRHAVRNTRATKTRRSANNQEVPEPVKKEPAKKEPPTKEPPTKEPPKEVVKERFSCNECSSGYMSSGQTWKNRHKYRRSNYNPFLVPTAIPYGPSGSVLSGYYVNNNSPVITNTGWSHPNPFAVSPDSKENFYASSSSSWTPEGNVTPANAPGSGTYLSRQKVKENYGADPTATKEWSAPAGAPWPTATEAVAAWVKRNESLIVEKEKLRQGKLRQGKLRQGKTTTTSSVGSAMLGFTPAEVKARSATCDSAGLCVGGGSPGAPCCEGGGEDRCRYSGEGRWPCPVDCGSSFCFGQCTDGAPTDYPTKVGAYCGSSLCFGQCNE
jgi:hypothetical protein